VPPAGTPLTYGMAVADSDRPEHLPYVKDGAVVVSFDIIGMRRDGMTKEEMTSATVAYFAAGMGVDQVPVILRIITEQLPEVDPAAIYMAGHSSAGTLVLQASQSVPGLAGVMAYCPVVDIEARLGAAVQTIRSLSPRFENGLASVNPWPNAARTACKVFLFGSTDDTNVRVAPIEAYVAKLTEAKKDVTLVKGRGSHYDSMIQQGIPAGIAWLHR
jgi:dienelactone hydrolase